MLKVAPDSDQLLHFRERPEASFQDAGYLCDKDSIFGNRNILILTAGNAVFHFTFIQHTATTVNDHFVRRDIIWKFCSGSEIKYWFTASVITDPVRKLAGSDIITLSVMGTAFCNQNPVSILNRRKCGNTFQLRFKFSFIS